MVKQVTIISGKGGTGKTTISSAFASLAENAVIADCDVDAADMHLIMGPNILETNDFYGLKVADINPDICTYCGICRESCSFGAIGRDIRVDVFGCEGCAVCEYVCPSGAIRMVDRKAGEVFSSVTRFGPMAHAKLGIGEEASGKLVSAVRTTASELAMKYGKDLIIIDGPPGTGCSVIAAITGVDLVLIVTEPTVSGMHDLERVLEVVNHFRIPALVCVNKYNINECNTQMIRDYCRDRKVGIIGVLPYDRTPTDAMLEGKTVIEYACGGFSSNVHDMWENIRDCLFAEKCSVFRS
ncbi:ATP-binding protein [Methanolobus halotolerans]|uniref:(4Fe-4S)-binding protein n=1 Tax=Methanolobus halotolerans TaxID=2052935 RepID=A0A4E0Q7S4_9EURY|nr:ATP-binding protein [Methanolobus halotolerans]TGC10926.1 (4Fe-4S)-binding protein [Methanolobus halotolerans]